MRQPVSTSDDPLILVADQDATSRDQLAAALEKAGFRVVKALDGGTAKKVVVEHDVYCAIVDHHMSPHDGFDFALFVQSNNMDLPMILTATTKISDLLTESQKRGFYSLLYKPVEPARLVNTVRRALKERGIIHE